MTKIPLHRTIWCLILLLSLTLLSIISLQGISSIRPRKDLTKQNLAEWGKSGNIIISHGPSMMPYPSWSKNSYSLFSSTGTLIDEVTGDGAYYPIAMPTHGGSYLYFPDEIRQVGNSSGIQSIKKYDPISFYKQSPTGRFSVLVLNASGAEKFIYQVVLVREDGKTFSNQTEINIHSLAVGEDYSLLIGESVEGRKLLSLDTEGFLKEIPFPQGYDLESKDFPFPHVNYLGSNRFEILSGDASDDTQGNMTTNFTSFEIEYGKDYKDSRRPISVSTFTKTLPADFRMTAALKGGHTSYVLSNGDVYINERLKNASIHTGNIDIAQKSDIIRIDSPNTEPLFGLKEKGTISIRSWYKPDKTILVIPAHDYACTLLECDFTQISIIA